MCFASRRLPPIHGTTGNAVFIDSPELKKAAPGDLFMLLPEGYFLALTSVASGAGCADAAISQTIAVYCAIAACS